MVRLRATASNRGITPGSLRDRGDIEKNTPVESGRGDEVESWTTLYANVPMDIQPLRGAEFYDAHQINAEMSVRIKLFWVPGVDSKMRVLSDGVTYEILAPPIDVGNMRRELQLLCRVLNQP